MTEKSPLAINGATIGVCRLISRNEEIELGIRHYLHDLLSPKFTDEKYTSLDEYFIWANGIKIRILQQPKHGKLRMVDGSTTYYVPDQDYLGKDVVEVLASAKDTYGKPISKRVIFFINAQPDYETEVAHDAYMKKYSYYLKKYCGRLSSRWIIPSEQKKSVGMESFEGKPGAA